VSDDAQQTPEREYAGQHYPHGAKLRRPVSWDEATTIRFWRKAQARLEKAREELRAAMEEERVASLKLHRKGLLVAEPAPAAEETASEPAMP
jgi:hypothetical protein